MILTVEPTNPKDYTKVVCTNQTHDKHIMWIPNEKFSTLLYPAIRIYWINGYDILLKDPE